MCLGCVYSPGLLSHHLAEEEKADCFVSYFVHYKCYSALDKLLGQLGINATWLSSIAYLQKQLRIFIFFYATFFSVITRFLIA